MWIKSFSKNIAIFIVINMIGCASLWSATASDLIGITDGLKISSYSKSVLNTNKEQILLSSDIYKLENIKNPKDKIIVHKDTKWEVLDYTDMPGIGFTAATFKNQKTGKIMVVYGGTTAGEKGQIIDADIIEDLTQIPFTNSHSAQFVEAINYIDKIKSKYKKSNIEITGHSLGGGLASYAGLRTGFKTTTINAAPITLSEKGLNALGEEGRNRLYYPTNQNNILNVRTNNDPISAASDGLTKIRKVGNKIKQYFGKGDIVFNTTPGKKVTVFTGTGHTLNPLINKAFQGELEQIISKKQEDPNKEKLKELTKKNKDVKAKIKKVKSEEENLKLKKERLARIRDEKRAAFDRVKNAEKDTDEYNYAKNRFFSLSADYRRLNNEISSLLIINNRDKKALDVMQKDITSIAMSLESSVDDYNNDIKTAIASESNSIEGNLWLGSVTFNSEDRLAGGATKLRYWGGQFSQTVAEAAQYSGGGPIFNGETSYLVENGQITSFATGHGENTATDNTKEFHIFDNEIDRTSSFFDQNINTLKLERQLSNGETLSIRTTGHYDYSAWGEWGQTGGLYTDINGGTGIEQKATHNNWQAGQKTQDLPVQGSATYTGVVQGHYYVGSVGSDYGGAISGRMNMTVDFANTAIVSGGLSLQKQDGANFATATMDEMQINRADSGFAGRLVGVDVAARNDGSQNMIIGQFNGPNAEEVSGIWNVTNTNGEFASGSFAGER